MEVNADFSRRVAVHGTALPWRASPIAGVKRRMLDRLGAEVARATSIVKYDAGSEFSPHVHGGGEEFLVLEGTFQDEHGDFPAGSYVRNPPGSRHRPGSAEGCVIFVKLWQFDPEDRRHVVIDSSKEDFQTDPERSGVTRLPLHEDAHEQVSMEIWAAGTILELESAEGLEVLVMEGGFTEGSEAFGAQSWLRLPNGGKARLTAGPKGAKVWLKAGHLAEAPKAPAPQS